MLGNGLPASANTLNHVGPRRRVPVSFCVQLCGRLDDVIKIFF
jgi:hypothetical protein